MKRMKERPSVIRASIMVGVALLIVGCSNLPEIKVAMYGSAAVYAGNTGSKFSIDAGVGSGPSSLAIGPKSDKGNYLYVLDSSDQTLSYYDPNTKGGANVTTYKDLSGLNPVSVAACRTQFDSAYYVFVTDMHGVAELYVNSSGVLTFSHTAEWPVQQTGTGQFSYPMGIACSPDGNTVAATFNDTDRMGHLFPGEIDFIPSSDPFLDFRNGSVTTGIDPTSVCFSADSSTAFVTNSGSGTVSAIDVAGMTVRNTITVGTGPDACAVNGSTLIVTNEYSGTITLINTSTDQVSATLNVGGHPNGVTFESSTKADVLSASPAEIFAVNVTDPTKPSVSSTTSLEDSGGHEPSAILYVSSG